DVIVDPTTSIVYHIEERPGDSGRYVIVHTITNKDVIPSPYNARSAVNFYHCVQRGSLFPQPH
ncbi:hypothetical protein BDN67DRAFT_954992, partial [Paxillus ammoniavirescens]